MWVLVQGYPVGGYDWGSRPDQGLPGYGHPDNSLPWAPGHPGNRPPWAPAYPGGGPVYPGGPVDPGYGRPGWSPVDPGYGQGGGFRPDNSLPWAPGHPGNRPPGSWEGRPDNSLPGQPIDPGFGGGIGQQPGHPSGQPIIPGATPHGTAIATAPPETVNATEGAWVLVNVQGTLVWAWAQKPTEKPPEAGTKPIEPPTAQPKK